MFRRLEEDGLLLIFNFEGERVAARLGETVAAALLAAGIANRQACMVPVADGMRVRRQRGARGVT